ncbi:Peroxide stress-activated histidine kinase mak1 [Lecanosticta acicola]|uniref:histidine kinase n=1 Tax=Lecanosticta acicola TaxID=111012 RepID=A0AAI8Z661_9PEZI|nr:Peroxide stress-activated histidine kinase mak1 [Lecanosticta acicola]
MKLPSTPQDTPKDDSDHTDDGDPTPTEAPPRPAVNETTTTPRPTLPRSPPARLAESSYSSIEAELHEEPADSPSAASLPPNMPEAKRKKSDTGSGSRPNLGKSSAQMLSAAGNPSDLRDALNARVLAQTRTRRSYGLSTGTKEDSKRVSPIQEEQATHNAPALTAVLGPQEPGGTASTVSTESTESNRTIRGSALPTPSGAPLRTPSYPFPYVPGTPSWRSFSTGGHQPFTALSPTVSNQPRGDHDTPGRSSVDPLSGDSTPAGNAAFMFGADFAGPEDPAYPTPNLYDLVLQLNAEPGFEAWWTTVTNLLHDHFKAERATLVQPLDPTDIENVPWGQKATFSMNGREEFAHTIPLRQQDFPELSGKLRMPEFAFRGPSNVHTPEEGPQKLHPDRLRPRLESRHSYAGHGREVREVLGTLNDAPTPGQFKARPSGPKRTVTHAPGIAGGVGPGRIPTPRAPSTGSFCDSARSEQEFSTVTGDTSPYAEVFGSLRSLDHEARPLIEAGGVNRVLDRGRIVMVTRDYTADNKKPIESRSALSGNAGRLFGNYRSVFASENVPEPHKDYEEYEQQPASPWAQSPAPSPAIQSDEDENPFFASDYYQVEDSFNPAVSPKDYTPFAQVGAIGVDHASTVIHLPLIHPTLSKPMGPLRETSKQNSTDRNSYFDSERRAPIAILTILTSAVPYPNNLATALKLLGPHLATSFSIAQQFSATHLQAVSIRHRRTASGNRPISNPMTIEPTALDDIVNADLEQPPGSISGSITSPSEYSGRSRASPSGSIIGTPGWDPAQHGWTASRSVTSTPAFTGSEMVDNYFDAKKRTGQRSACNASTTTTPAKSMKRGSGSVDKGAANEDEGKSSRSERKLKVAPASTDDKLSVQPSAQEQSPPHPAEATSPSRPALRPSLASFAELSAPKQHSLLHSYGADFHSTFNVSPSMTPGEARAPGLGGHARKGSYPEDMPPPSERLLRTIIDSVPVQIFTAQPETGLLSWVNSKFLIYRGQEPRQVLNDPWAAIHPEDRNDFLPAWHRSLRTYQQLQQKVRLQRFDGNYRWFYVRAAPLKDKRQKVVHWIGTMMDFHEQQLAEFSSARQAETAASEAKYRALANSSPQVVFAVNRVKGVTFCNTQWLQYSGQNEVQALGVGFMDHVHPEDLEKCRLPTFEGATDEPTNVPTSVPFGPRRTASQSAASSLDSSETEKAPSSDDSVAASVSPSSQKPPQRKLSELASKGILKVARDADGRPSYSTEVRLKSKDGNFRWHLVRVLLADPLLHDEEETWYGTCTDINDHKTLERDLKETMDEKSRFLSNMSHEIRTPLNGITGMVNFLIDSSLTAEQMEHVNIIRASTEGLRGLINDILDLSKAEAGMIQLSMDWLYVRALIEEVNDLTSAMAIDKGLELNYIVEEDVPSQIKGDRFRIRQIMLNIVGNAIKFTQRGEVFVRCCLQKDDGQLAKNEMYIRFEVVDTGRGFTDKEAEYLFKRFSQIDGSSTRQHGGTGLGLVISKQLAQLHGGDMSAKGVPEKGSTFTFYIKTTVPSRHDQPPPSTPGAASLPVLPAPPEPIPTPTATPPLTKIPSAPSERQAKPSPKFLPETTQSPSPSPYLVASPDADTGSPSVSSASSDPSVRSAARTGSLRSERSSVSSIVPDPTGSITSKMTLNLRAESSPRSEPSPSGTEASSTTSNETVVPSVASPSGSALAPPMFSILVVAPLKYSREATVQHIDKTLPKNVPHQITSRESLSECRSLLCGEEPVIFTHVVAVLQDVEEIIALMDQVLRAATTTTAIVLITDLAQRRKIMEQAPNYNYDQLVADRRLRFVFKPLKPSRFGLIFDPQKEREMSLDRNQDSAQQVAVNQKQVFDELTRRLGNRDKRVLLVEDNRVNQMVILKFLAKASIKVETVLDGVQCTDKVFANPHGHYSIILCDLHMPNKDGYQTCKEVRKWEKKNKYPHLPIIALSANVLGDVYQKCVAAGFNSYMTKPVDFKELSTLLMNFMDCDPNKTHELMKLKRGHGAGSLPSLFGR